MHTLDFKSPFDELTELRSVLTTQQIAEMTGLRRETISRARPDSRFQRRTEKALGDLYVVVTRMKSTTGEDLGHLAAVLRRPQPLLGEHSIAELLKDGQVERVLEHLSGPDPSEDERLENLQLDPAIEAELEALDEAPGPRGSVTSGNDRVTAMLATDAGLGARISKIEERIRDLFGPGVEIRRNAITDFSAPEGRDHLYLGVLSDLPFDEEIDLLAELLDQEEALLGPVQDRLTIGTL